MLRAVDIVSVESELGPTLEGRDIVGPWFTIGEIVVVRLTVPLNPFVPLMLTVNVAEDPLWIVWVVGVAVIVKSWEGISIVMPTE